MTPSSPRPTLTTVGDPRPLPRASLRLVTLGTARHQPLFGTVAEGRFYPTPLGFLARQCWLGLPLEYPELTFEWFQVRPAAIVALVRIPQAAERDILRGVVAHYKAMVSRWQGRKKRIWEGGYEAVPAVQGLRVASRRPGWSSPRAASQDVTVHRIGPPDVLEK